MTEFRPKARRPRGFADRRGATLARERAIVEKVLGVYEAWGFERLETSAFEYADALGKFLPDQDRPNEGVFALTDDDDQWMALRYDLTAPLARFVAENYDALPKPYRRCAAGPVWRNEKPGPGRFREFWQCDADSVGAPSPAADAEMIAMACAALEAAGASNTVIKISSRGLLDGILTQAGVTDASQRMAALRAVDKVDRLSWAGVEQLLGAGRMDESGDYTVGAKLSDEAIRAVMGLLIFATSTDVVAGSRKKFLETVWESGGAENLSSVHAELSTISETLDALGVDDRKARFDISVVRGLEYYTGAVFEAELLGETKDENGNLVRFGSVGGGGRYDDLVSRFKGQPIPATGFSVGVSRLAAALTAQEEARAADGPVVVLPFDASAMGACMALAAELRGAFARASVRRAAEVYLGGSGPKAQLKYADKRGSPVAVIVGGDEVRDNTVSIKNLRLGAEIAANAEDREAWNKARENVQVTVPRAEMAATVLKMLAP
ncbi:MAG: histidine--tRNA ligase [Hyphomonadaceae bacterium]|nr:histidine--tRNA ligase [Hyphomonadaceae bacterium]